MESCTEQKSQDLTKTASKFDVNNKRSICYLNLERFNGDDNDGEGEEAMEEECDAEVWETLSRSFRQVQAVLDQNRMLIQQVNENHQSKLHDNLVQNVALIREINGNISKVINLYSDLSVNFCYEVHQRRAIMASKGYDRHNSHGDDRGGSAEP